MLGRPVGIVCVLVPPYLMMMQDGQCPNYLDTNASERLASKLVVPYVFSGVIVDFMTALAFLVYIYSD